MLKVVLPFVYLKLDAPDSDFSNPGGVKQHGECFLLCDFATDQHTCGPIRINFILSQSTFWHIGRIQLAE